MDPATVRKGRITLVAAVVLVLAAMLNVSASAAPASEAHLATLTAGGVSSLSYSPKPFYDDQLAIEVQFTTTGRVGPGRKYYVTFVIYGRHERACVHTSISSHPELGGKYSSRQIIKGAPGRTYKVTLIADLPLVAFEDSYYCPGSATLEVGTMRIQDDTPIRETKTLRQLKFRVLRAP